MKSFLLMLCGLGLATFAAAAKPSERPPNLIFILTDDHRWDAMGEMDRMGSKSGWVKSRIWRGRMRQAFSLRVPWWVGFPGRCLWL